MFDGNAPDINRPFRTAGEILEAHKQRLAKDNEAIEMEAKRLADVFAEHVALMLMQGDLVKIEADGHYLKLSLTEEGASHLARRFESPIRGSLADAAFTAATRALQERNEIAGWQS